VGGEGPSHIIDVPSSSRKPPSQNVFNGAKGEHMLGNFKNVPDVVLVGSSSKGVSAKDRAMGSLQGNYFLSNKLYRKLYSVLALEHRVHLTQNLEIISS
jgi:hypothetical protein